MKKELDKAISKKHSTHKCILFPKNGNYAMLFLEFMSFNTHLPKIFVIDWTDSKDYENGYFEIIIKCNQNDLINCLNYLNNN